MHRDEDNLLNKEAGKLSALAAFRTFNELHTSLPRSFDTSKSSSIVDESEGGSEGVIPS